MTDEQLSPTAQAVLDAFNNRGLSSREWHDGKAASLKLAAALKAAVDQVFPLTKSPWGSTLVPVLTAQESRARLLTIAAELEGK